MFVRFKRVTLSPRYGIEHRYSIHAVLVESYRDKGKPRQRVLKYLASVKERDFFNPAKRTSFLDVVRKRLDQLDLDPRTIAELKVRLFHRSLQYLHRQQH